MEFRDYIAPLVKWWWLILIAVLVSAVTSIFVTSRQPPIFESRTTLMIGSAIDDPNPSNLQFNLGQQLALTYADIARRDPVRNASMEALGLTWLPKYIVAPVQNTQLIEFVVTDVSPARAQAVANELANQLILTSPTNSQQDEQKRQAFINSQLDDLELTIQATQDELLLAQQELGNLVSAREIQETQTQIVALESKLRSLQTNYASLLDTTQAGAINTISVIEEANLPTQPVGPDLILTAIMATGIGFLLAAGAAYLLEYLDNTVKSPADVSKLTTAPTLAGITDIKGDDPPSKLITLREPRSPISEAYRKLRTGIQFASIDSPNRSSLLITSTNPGEGKSVTAANLAIVMAQAGNNVLLVDADLRRPTQHNIFELHNGYGLTNFLLNIRTNLNSDQVEKLFKQAVDPTEVDGLSVMTSGPIPPNPSELLGSSKMRNVIDVLCTNFDLVVLDSPPVIAVTDGVVLSTQVDNVLIVADAGRTQRNHLKQTIQQLEEVKSHLIGVVLNRLSDRSDGYYYYRKAYFTEDDENRQDSIPSNTDGGRLRGILGRKSKETIGD